VYNDDIPLTLYSTEKILNDITKAHFRQEEILCSLKKLDEKFNGDCKNFMESLPIHKNKFTSRKMVKDVRASISFTITTENVGWNINVYKKQDLPPSIYYQSYGQDVPVVEEAKQVEIETGEIYVEERDLSAQTLETYLLICEFFEENYRNTWTQRSVISKYLQQNGHGDVNAINARFEHLIAKGSRKQKEGLVFKKNGHRWSVKKLL
jgi:hypothetical protein